VEAEVVCVGGGGGGELMLLLHTVRLQVDRADRWRWTLEASNDFSVRSAYDFLSATPPLTLFVPVASLWHKDVPLKFVLFACVCSKTGCLQRTICIGVESSIVILCCVWLGVARLNLLSTCFYIVIYLGLFGTSYTGGLASQQ